MNQSVVLFLAILSFSPFGLLVVPAAIAQELPAEQNWQAYKENVIDVMASLPGWCSSEKANLMMDLIKEHRLQRCVEIGVFGGSSLFPIAKAVQFNGVGLACGIDPWGSEFALRGLEAQKVDYEWWSSLNLDAFYLRTSFLLQENALTEYCQLLRTSAEIAADFFEDESIDFIHFDGNHTAEFSYQEILAFFPKVKNGGFILLNDACWMSLRNSLVFLLERTQTMTKITSTMPYALFYKTKQRLDEANELFHDQAENSSHD